MFDFLRSLEEQIIVLLAENLTPAEARKIMLDAGAKPADLSNNNLRKTWIELLKKFHPDVTGGDSKRVMRINAAYDVLKANAGLKNDQSPMSSKPTADPAPWQTDDRSAYNGWAREDYTDQNWFKKRMWELSGRSQHRWTIYAFDGRFFRSSLTVFGSMKIFPDMARAMVMFNSRGGNPYETKAVFVQDSRHLDVLLLIWYDGNMVDPPVPLEHESPNSNPSNDQTFMRTLPNTLNQIATGRDA